jgi:[protein-PII] uridylyltransferase
MVTSLRTTRVALMEQLNLQGDAFCRTFSDSADVWLAEIVDTATGGDPRHLALVAVGGYGRGSLCPFSDLDLVLVHDGRGDVSAVADRIWYPVWDEGVSLDHSVRKPKEVIQMAGKDLRVALGLLDARVVAGDRKVAQPVLDEVGRLWRSTLGGQFLDELEAQMAARHSAQGDLAYLLEPNLKESHGGLRDVNVLRALSTYTPRLGELVDLGALDRAASFLTRVRVELHRATGRELDRLLLQEQDLVSTRLGFSDADALMRAISEVGRTVARLSDDTWRRRSRWMVKPEVKRSGWFSSNTVLDGQPEKVPTPLEDGLVELDGEVTLTPSAQVGSDTTLAFRIAAVAAETDLPIALGAVHRLADQMGPIEEPWAPELLASFIRLLSAGKAAIPPFETLDQQGIITRYLPEWSAVRYHHQRNSYHSHTSDRHLLEAVANAAALLDRVDRPDLLLLGTLLHDIGKGRPGDHTEVGMELAATIGPRIGLSQQDTETIVAMVEHHLLIPDTATRRDLDDPATIERVAELVHTRERLLLLQMLTIADSQATGPAAWSPWKAGLSDELVRRTLAVLDGTEQPAIASWMTDEHRVLMQAARNDDAVRVAFQHPRIAVAAPDRPGLLANVTGTLALFGLEVHSADALGEDGVALELFTISSDHDTWPTLEGFSQTLAGVLDDTISLSERLAVRHQDYRTAKRTLSARPTVPSVVADRDASRLSTVIEVRGEDRLGLLHDLTACLYALDIDVLSARVSTIGPAAIDVFYVRTADGLRLDDGETLKVVCDALNAVVTRT